ncbi:MAG: ZIP family metal transporter [Nanoarchaeota archaeon]|nr:ZIP family metal transporter [Nanoarchaeota archaeon]
MFEAVLLSLIAGLATGLGGLIGILIKPGNKTTGAILGFASGVMITLAFLDLVMPALATAGYFIVIIGFGLGAFLMFGVDNFIPHMYRHEKEKGMLKSRNLKTGMLVAIGIAIHNFPEGIAVGAGYAHAPQFGIIIAIAIALHNIPEGIVTVIPLISAGVKKKKALAISLFSGIVEPLGAIIALTFLNNITGFVPFGLAFAGGVMAFLTLDELIPMCKIKSNKNLTSIGIIIGCLSVMTLSAIFGI